MKIDKNILMPKRSFTYEDLRKMVNKIMGRGIENVARILVIYNNPCPTNGDIIKALLNLKDEDIKAKESCLNGIILEYVIDTDIYFLRFDGSWWNAPYRAESED